MKNPFLCRAIPSVNRGTPFGMPPLELECVGPEITREQAQAHVLLTQRVACCVRVTAKRVEYNAVLEWPTLWNQHNNPRYFVVITDVDLVTYGSMDIGRQQGKSAFMAYRYGMGADAFQRAMKDSVRNGIGMMEFGQMDGMRYIESPYVDEKEDDKPVHTAPPRPRKEWWHR